MTVVAAIPVGVVEQGNFDCRAFAIEFSWAAEFSILEIQIVRLEVYPVGPLHTVLEVDARHYLVLRWCCNENKLVISSSYIANLSHSSLCVVYVPIYILFNNM